MLNGPFEWRDSLLSAPEMEMIPARVTSSLDYVQLLCPDRWAGDLRRLIACLLTLSSSS